MTLYASHPHVFHCASFIRRDTDSWHFVIDMEPSVRRRTNSAARSQRNKEQQEQNGDASVGKRQRAFSNSEDAELVQRAQAAAAAAAKARRRRCRCCSRGALLVTCLMSLLVFGVLFVWYVNSEVERYCYETFPAWICESTGAEHIKCQLKALFMCKYSVELVEYLHVNATQITSRCEHMIEQLCISLYTQQ